ncbi:MAG TPA: Ig-like domain-containing protein, partial [Gemmatimonadaceae bacterium]|nr:Ig-like domain-containing protein [Gemmatimonadaceae bacterium]
MSATTSTLVPSQTLQLSATAKDISGQVLSRTFAWTSSDQAKATVSSSGMVSGVAPGTATITAEVDGKSATTIVTVLDGGVVSSIGTTLNLMSGGVQIIVPDSAVVTPINMSVVPSAAFASDPRVVKGTPFDFGPSGTTFAKPITLRIKYDPANLPPGTEEAAL